MRTCTNFLFMLLFFGSFFLPFEDLKANDLHVEKGGFQIKQLVLDPNPPEVGDQEVTIRLYNREGNPVTDAEVEIEAFMPAMGSMAAMSTKAIAEHKGDGEYTAEIEIAMAGSWELPIRVKSPGSDKVTEFPFNITIGIENFIYKGKMGKKGASGKEEDPESYDGPNVYLSQPRRQLIGVEIGKVERKTVSRQIRTVARLGVDESLTYDMVLKYSGYIVNLYADRTGEPIRKGEPLFEIYSPQLYAAKLEYLQLVKGKGNRTLLRNVREKLLLWDVTPKQIKEMEQQFYIPERHTIYSPISGFILKKNLSPGSHVVAGKQLYRIAGLHKLWALADIFEHEAAIIKTGDRVILNLTYLPGKDIEGNISYIYPTVDSKTRTIKVRIEIPNPELDLRPGMYGDAIISGQMAERLILPRRAVLFSGKHKYVFKALGDGYFAPVEIQTGIQNGNWFEIRSGLKEGDRVSFSANFLISSEAQLRNAMPRWGKPEQREEQE